MSSCQCVFVLFRELVYTLYLENEKKNMKKLYVNSIIILLAALCFVFAVCNQDMTAGKSTGIVRVVIGGGAVRVVDEAGLSQFDGNNTKITITGEDGTVWKKESPNSVGLTIPAEKYAVFESSIVDQLLHGVRINHIRNRAIDTKNIYLFV